MEDSGRRPTDTPPWAWQLVVRSVRWFMRHVLGWRLRVREPSVAPRPGHPLVVVCNHTSNVDLLLVADTVWRRLRRWVQPLVKTELFHAPVLGALVRHTGAIPVARDEAGQREAAYADAVQRLRAGATVMIAPEGTVTHDGSLLPLRQGAARLAIEADVDILVVTHFGAQRGFSPVARFPHRNVVVTMVMDVLSPLPDEDESVLTGRIAATLLDRSEELRATYPQADPTARWWPPYSAPASPSATARKSLERYQASMAEAVEHARERMARMAEEHEVEHRVAQMRERAHAVADDLGTRTRARTEALTEQAQVRMEQLADQARERAAALGERLPTSARDASETDAGETDAGETDAGETDAGETDAGETDAGETDAGDRPREGDRGADEAGTGDPAGEGGRDAGETDDLPDEGDRRSAEGSD